MRQDLIADGSDEVNATHIDRAVR